jgi:hypothetical protein
MSIPQVNGRYVNTDNSNGTSYTFTDTTIPHTYPLNLKYLRGGKKIKSYNMKRRIHKSKKNNSRKRRVTKRKHHKMRGGYSQYQNNQPYYKPYSIGGVDPMLANPAPYFISNENSKLENLDNYNHYTNKGFASKGWF